MQNDMEFHLQHGKNEIKRIRMQREYRNSYKLCKSILAHITFSNTRILGWALKFFLSLPTISLCINYLPVFQTWHFFFASNIIHLSENAVSVLVSCTHCRTRLVNLCASHTVITKYIGKCVQCNPFSCSNSNIHFIVSVTTFRWEKKTINDN